IERGDVRGQHPRLIFQALIEDYVAIFRAKRIEMREMQRMEPNSRKRPDVSLGRTLEIHLIVEFLGGVFAGIAILEFEFANASVDGFGAGGRYPGKHTKQRKGYRYTKAYHRVLPQAVL